MAREAGADRATPAQARVDLADLFRTYGASLGPLSNHLSRVMRHIVQCKTAALGGHAWCCEVCRHTEVSYNSCRDRHCPNCQWRKQQQWLADRQAELLPVPYFHIVFTVPQALHPIFLAYPTECISLLFSALKETLLEVALNPEMLGAQIGFLAVLHTWTQKLTYHPHVHCIVPGGGLTLGSMRWKASHPKFFLPTRALSDVFRGKLLSKLQRAAAANRIEPGVSFHGRLRDASIPDWVVYCKRTFAEPMQVLNYLGRYTHRIAISNSRIVSLHHGQVTFSYRDRADHNRKKLLTLSAQEFLRRFLLHVVPPHLVRIRYYGLLASPQKRILLDRCRAALQPRPNAASEDAPKPQPTHSSDSFWRCPSCHVGRLLLVARLSPLDLHWLLHGRSTWH